MIVKGKQTSYVEVELDKTQVNEIIKRRLYKLIDLPVGNRDSGVYLKDGKLYEWETQYTSHSWQTERVLREATELDKAVFLILNEMKKSK